MLLHIKGIDVAMSADQMVQRRLRGHRPYGPTCEVCQSCRGVPKHSRKKPPKETEFEIHTDFGFLNKDFEYVPESGDSERGNVKFLVVRESCSSSSGCVLILVIDKGIAANFRSGCLKWVVG